MSLCLPSQILILIFFVSMASDVAAAEPEFHGQPVTVRSCDEIAVRHKARIIAVRIAGIDCPGRKQPFATEARSFVGKLINKQTIRVKPIGHDRHRRVWAHVFLPDGRSLAYEMVKSGWAQASASAVDERLSALEEEARRGKRGLWDDRPLAAGKTRDHAPRVSH
ncbi:thermonuclease family protein [Nitrospira sp. Nam74]